MKTAITHCQNCNKRIELHRLGQASLCASCIWAARDAEKTAKEVKAWNQYALGHA